MVCLVCGDRAVIVVVVVVLVGIVVVGLPVFVVVEVGVSFGVGGGGEVWADGALERCGDVCAVGVVTAGVFYIFVVVWGVLSDFGRNWWRSDKNGRNEEGFVSV